MASRRRARCRLRVGRATRPGPSPGFLRRRPRDVRGESATPSARHRIPTCRGWRGDACPSFVLLVRRHTAILSRHRGDPGRAVRRSTAGACFLCRSHKRVRRARLAPEACLRSPVNPFTGAFRFSFRLGATCALGATSHVQDLSDEAPGGEGGRPGASALARLAWSTQRRRRSPPPSRARSSSPTGSTPRASKDAAGTT